MSHTPMPIDPDEYYGDILEGLAVWFDSPFVVDLRATVARFPEPDLGNALNRNQVASKRWLVDRLREAAGSCFGTITILGGWFGVLGAMLLHDRRLAIERVVSVDIDPRCAAVAESLNATHVRAGRFVAETGDMLHRDYRAAARATEAASNDVVVNTSCEHIAAFGEWFARLPQGQLAVLQSNDYRGVDGHVNCAPDLEGFRAQAPLRELMFAGTLPAKRYRRFMLIGRK
jgi:hypothetical protein